MEIIRKPKALKHINRKAILNILRTSGEISVAVLSRKVKLSKTTLMKIMNYYVENGLVIITGKGVSSEEGGKRPNIFKFNKDGGYAIGMDISANRLLSVATNLNGEILKKVNVDLETDENFDSFLGKVIESYEQVIEGVINDRKKIIGMAIGAYAITNYKDGIIIFSPHFPSWGENVHLKDHILKFLPDKIPVYVDNNNRFQAFAEKVAGIARGKKNIVAFKAGKGLGSGVIMDGEIKRGDHFLFGEVGHVTINPEGSEICSCGAKGCFEAMVSTKRVLRMAKEGYEESPDSLIFAKNKPEDINMNDIFNAADGNDVLALKILEDISRWFAIGISNIILLYDPQMIVIQGIFTGAGKKFLNNIRKKVNEISLPRIKKESDIEYSKLGDEVGALGAASYVISMFFN
ncbi:MAG: transcriptional regulator [Actinobacteria bacterium]|nr:transcriptional regulator [Actinomycetota bacterium]